MDEAQKIVDKAKPREWDKETFMAKFYPTYEKVLAKEKPKATGFKWGFKTPSALTAEEVVSSVEQEGVAIKRPLFSSNQTQLNKNNGRKKLKWNTKMN